MLVRLTLQSNAAEDLHGAEHPVNGEIEIEVCPDSLEPTRKTCDYVLDGEVEAMTVRLAMKLIGGPARFKELVAGVVDFPLVFRRTA